MVRLALGHDSEQFPQSASPVEAAEALGKSMESQRRPTTSRGVTQPIESYASRRVRSPLVGRDQEISLVLAAVERALEFQAPQLVTIIGNQGTGKSRLVDEVVQRVSSRTLVYRGRAEEGGGRYAAIARLLRDRFAIPDSASEAEAKDCFRREVESVFGGAKVEEVLHVLGAFLDLHFPESPFLRVLSESPRQYDEIMRSVLRRFIEVDAQKGPVILVVDDLQWAHEDTLSLLQELGEGLGGSPLVLMACSRPDLVVRMGGWGESITDHLRVDLSNLPPDDAEAMFRNLLDRCEAIPPDIVEDAVEMTGGNPHFLEQLVRLFLDNGTIDTSGAAWMLDADRAAETDLPITIEEAIEARIASLAAPERDVLEKGAVFGNVFWVGAVVALTRLERAKHAGNDTVASPAGPLDYDWSDQGEDVRRKILAVVDELVARDYLLRLDIEDSTIRGDTELVFKHNLERELIANSTDSKRLARHHRLAAQWLETSLNQRSEEQMEFLAQLYERGGDRRRAAYSYLAGADKARERFANEQAVELYGKGLALLEEDDAVALLDALHNLGSVLDLVGRTAEAQEKFSLMLRRAWLFDHRAKGGAAHSRLGRIHRRLGEYDQGMAHFRAAHDLFQAAGDRRGIAGTLDDIGRVHWLRGAYAQALEFHRQALAIRRALGDQRSIALSLANIGRVHHETGAFKAAGRQFREALELRRSIDDRSGVVQSLCDLGGVHSADGAFDQALAMFEEARQISAQIGDKLAQTEVLARLGECLAALQRSSEAIEALIEGIAIAESIGNRIGVSDCHRRLADVYLAVGDAGQAQAHANKALELGRSVGSRLHVGTAHRALAEAIFALGREPETLASANEHFCKSIEVLGGMKNELELARCYRAYAEHRTATGNEQEADKLRRRADEIYARLRGASDLE